MIGLPYTSFDCWDVVKMFHKKVFSNDLELGILYNGPSIRTESHEEWAVFSKWLINENKCKFIKVSKPMFGDIILLNIFGLPAHLGVFLDEKTMLHTSASTGCMIDRLARWEKRIEGYYRWQ